VTFPNSFVHPILRDATEQYLAVVQATGVQVFELQTGAVQTVLAPGGYG